MIARTFLALLTVLLSACGSEGRLASPDPDRDAVRGAVVGFLDALAGRDEAHPLPSTIRGPLLEDWTAWLGSGPELQGGAVRIRALRVAAIDGDVARAELDATVTVGRPGSDQHVGEREVTFRGPVALVRAPEAAGGWLVTDLVREGRPMSVAITVFDPPVQGVAGGIEVEVRSLYRFATGTVANLRISNGSEGTVRMDRPPTRIQAAGRFVGATAAAGPFLEAIASGTSREGSVGFHPVPLRWLPEKVMVHLEDGTVVTVELPVEAFVPPITET